MFKLVDKKRVIEGRFQKPQLLFHHPFLPFNLYISNIEFKNLIPPFCPKLLLVSPKRLGLFCNMYIENVSLHV